MANEANPLYCRQTRQGVFRKTDLRILIEEPLNIISIDYVKRRIKGFDGDVGTMQPCRIISPVGLGALLDVSL